MQQSSHADHVSKARSQQEIEAIEAEINAKARQCQRTWGLGFPVISMDLLQPYLDRMKQVAFSGLWEWRGIESDDVCQKCNGAGVRAYPSTSAWYGGIGGQVITVATCDCCWGTGKKSSKGVDLRRLTGAIESGCKCSACQEIRQQMKGQ